MSLRNMHFILVRPQIGENIGSVARAIKNFNISKLRIINPRCEWPNKKALATSVGAKDILKSTKIYNSLDKSEYEKITLVNRGKLYNNVYHETNNSTQGMENLIEIFTSNPNASLNLSSE